MARVVQHALNLDYKAKQDDYIKEDGDFGAISKKLLGKHYVEKGEKQWLVTAAEIIMYCKGFDPNGIEYPGTFGNGLAKATGKTKLNAQWFIDAIVKR